MTFNDKPIEIWPPKILQLHRFFWPAHLSTNHSLCSQKCFTLHIAGTADTRHLGTKSRKFLWKKTCPTKRNRSVSSRERDDGMVSQPNDGSNKQYLIFFGNLWESIIGGSLCWITHSLLDSFILKKSLPDFLPFWQFGSKIPKNWSILGKFPNPPLGMMTSAELAINLPKYIGLASFPVVIFPEPSQSSLTILTCLLGKGTTQIHPNYIINAPT